MPGSGINCASSTCSGDTPNAQRIAAAKGPAFNNLYAQHGDAGQQQHGGYLGVPGTAGAQGHHARSVPAGAGLHGQHAHNHYSAKGGHDSDSYHDKGSVRSDQSLSNPWSRNGHGVSHTNYGGNSQPSPSIPGTYDGRGGAASVASTTSNWDDRYIAGPPGLENSRGSAGDQLRAQGLHGAGLNRGEYAAQPRGSAPQRYGVGKDDGYGGALGVAKDVYGKDAYRNTAPGDYGNKGEYYDYGKGMPAAPGSQGNHGQGQGDDLGSQAGDSQAGSELGIEEAKQLAARSGISVTAIEHLASIGALGEMIAFAKARNQTDDGSASGSASGLVGAPGAQASDAHQPQSGMLGGSNPAATKGSLDPAASHGGSSEHLEKGGRSGPNRARIEAFPDHNWMNM